MTIQTNISETDLVLRFNGGQRNGEFVNVDTPNCLLGVADGDSHTPYCAIFRGPRGASLRSYSSHVRVNGSASSVHWLKDGDRVELKDSTVIEVSQLGCDRPADMPEVSVRCDNSNQDRFSAFTKATETRSDLASVEPTANETIRQQVDNRPANDRFTLIESKLSNLQNMQAETDARFSQIDNSLNQLSEQMAQLIAVSSGNASLQATDTQTTESQFVESPKTAVQEEIFVSSGLVADSEPEETFVNEIPVVEAASEETANVEQTSNLETASPETSNQENTEASQMAASLESVFADELNVEETAPLATTEPVANSEPEETFITEIPPTQEAVEEIVSEFQSHEEETIVGFETSSDNETILADLSAFTSDENVSDENVSIENAVTSEVTQPEPTQPETVEPNQDEMEARLADLARVFGDQTAEEPQADSPADTPALEPTIQPEEQILAPEPSVEPSIKPSIESAVDAVFNSEVANSQEHPAAAVAEEVPYVEEASNVETALTAEEQTQQASLEARLESFMSKAKVSNELNEAVETTPADAQPSESFEQLTHSQNETESSAGFSNNEEPQATEAAIPEAGSFASELLQEVMDSPEEPAEAVNEVQEEEQQDPETTASEGNSLQDVLARMQENGQWQGLSEDDGNDSFQAPEPTPAPVEPAAAEAPAASNPDEDVEDYMSQLLSRMRGGAPEPKKQEVKVEKKTLEITKVPETFVPPEKPLRPEDFKPKRKAQKPKSFDAMRELANSASRTNIKRSEEERRKALGLVQVGIAVGSFLLSGYYFLFSSEGLFDTPFIVGVLCLGVCGAFCYRSFMTMRQNEELEARKLNNKTAEKKESQQAAPQEAE